MNFEPDICAARSWSRPSALPSAGSSPIVGRPVAARTCAGSFTTSSIRTYTSARPAAAIRPNIPPAAAFRVFLGAAGLEGTTAGSTTVTATGPVATPSFTVLMKASAITVAMAWASSGVVAEPVMRMNTAWASTSTRRAIWDAL